MIARTTCLIGKPIDELWPLLCDSRMTQDYTSPLFWLGLPRPVKCHLLDGLGGVGQRRECVAARGFVQQRITIWKPPVRLGFRMEHTNLAHRIFFNAVTEQFDLAPLDALRTRVTRTTSMAVKPAFIPLYPFLKVGVLTIHRYVFKNWDLA